MTRDIRYTRQVRLAEVGDAGQARLLQTTVRAPEHGVAAAIEARYLTAAGVKVTPGQVAREEAPSWLLALHPAARDVAAGAHGALSVIRAVLSDSPHPAIVRTS